MRVDCDWCGGSGGGPDRELYCDGCGGRGYNERHDYYPCDECEEATPMDELAITEDDEERALCEVCMSDSYCYS